MSDVVVGVAVRLLFVMVRDTRGPTKVFILYICMVSCIREKSSASTSNRPAVDWSIKVNHYRTTRGRLDEAYSDEEVSVSVHTCMSFVPKIAVVVDVHSLFAIHTSDVVEGNISAYFSITSPLTTKAVLPSIAFCSKVSTSPSLDPPLHRIEIGVARSDDWLSSSSRVSCMQTGL